MSELLSEIGEMLVASTVNEEDLEPVEEQVEDPQEEHEVGVTDTEEEVPGEEEEEIQEGEEDPLDESGLDTGTEEGLEQDPTSDVPSPSESSETISLRAEVKSLREMLQSVTTQLLQQQTQVQTAPQQEQSAPVVDTNFLDGEDFDDVLTNPDAFNRLLIKVANLSQQNVVPVVTERVLTTTQRQSAQKRAVDNFYQKNPDLAGVRQTVSVVAQNLGAQNPNLTTEQLLEQTATMTRTMLQMPLKPPTNKTSSGPTKVIRRVASPAKATTTASRKQKPTTKKKSSLQTDIEAMLDAV